MEKDISIAKIVATATPTSWSQAYNAGKLFAVLSLTTDVETEENALNLLGKEVLENLEAEFFALETKDLEGIKTAVKSSQALVLENTNCSFVVGTIVNNVLYTFAKNGSIQIKRGSKLGRVLEAGNTLESASGFLEDQDIIILATSQFTNIVSQNSLLSSMDSLPPSQIAENLAPMVHEKADGGATAIIIEYKKEEVQSEEIIASQIPKIEPVEQSEQTPQAPFEQNYMPKGLQEPQRTTQSLEFMKKYLFFAKNKIQNVKFSTSFDRSRRTVLTVAGILLLILLISIFFAVKKQNDAKTQALVAQYYAPAQKQYDEGQGLLGLNQALARDSFSQAQKLLIEGQPKFDKGSSERKQLDSLLIKVNESLETSANIKTVTPAEVSSSESKLLAEELKNSSAQYVTKEGNDIFTLSSSGVSKNSKEIIKKDWTTAGGLGVYFGNVYVLDKTAKQILKFVSTSSDFVKTNYFTKGTTPDVSSSQSTTIDGSIWVLLKDGTVLKFTRGNKDNLSLTGLDKPFSSPTRIFTNADSDNVYVLDNGNSRIVVFDKTGAYKSQYQADILKTAKDLDVNEKDGKLYILQGSKIYLITL